MLTDPVDVNEISPYHEKVIPYKTIKPCITSIAFRLTDSEDLDVGRKLCDIKEVACYPYLSTRTIINIEIGESDAY